MKVDYRILDHLSAADQEYLRQMERAHREFMLWLEAINRAVQRPAPRVTATEIMARMGRARV